MHGEICSMDRYHVAVEKCSHRLKKNHLGRRSKLTCGSFNLIANHKRKIPHTTPGHPARLNNKTIVLFDIFARQLNNGSIMQDHMFELFEMTSDCSIITVKCRGG